MEYLSPELISSLIREHDAQLASKSRKRNRNKNFFVMADGTVFTGKPSAEIAGRFEGNVGSKRRSRKGRTVTLPQRF